MCKKITLEDSKLSALICNSGAGFFFHHVDIRKGFLFMNMTFVHWLSYINVPKLWFASLSSLRSESSARYKKQVVLSWIDGV